jgi:ABC-type Zn uptake system ZnuABC Zn-binding protein ZnuA
VSQTLNDIVKKVAEASGAKIGGTLYSDSLGVPGTPTGSYLGMVRHNVTTVVDSLK